MKFPKPPTRKTVLDRKRRANRAWIRHIRERVIGRDQGCRACRYLKTRSDGVLHMHELIYRSKTRGQAIDKRINTANCLMLCALHHQAVHAKRLAIHFHDEHRGADGELIFKVWTG